MQLIKKGWLLSLLLAVLSCPGLLKSSAQTLQPANLGSVEGVVLNQQGKPIADADVHALLQEDMRRTVASTTTDSAGKFTLHDLPAGGIFVYANKESDGYPDAFFAFFTTPNGQYQVAVKVEAGQVVSGVTMKLGAKFAYLKFNVTDESGRHIAAALVFTREDQPGSFQTGTTGENTMMVPPVPFRLTIQAEGYEPWHYGGANYAGKAGLIALKPGQTLSLDVRLRKK